VAVRCVILLAVALAAPARAEPPRQAFVFWGEPDPTGVDQSFLALGRRRGATVVRETPGRLGDEPAAGALADAVAAYQALKLDEAEAALDALEREAVARGGGRLTQGELVDLYAYRAAARMARGDEAAAWDDLLALARLAPGRPLDPARFAPRLVEAERRVAQSVPPPAALALGTDPPDALVIVDGVLLGRGRVETHVVPGPHFVRAERPGFTASGRVADVPPSGASVELRLEARAAPSAADLARRGAAAGAGEVMGAWVSARDGQARVELARVEVAGARIAARAALADDEQLTSTALAAAVESLAPVEAPPRPRAPPPWYRRPLVWGLVAGGAAAVALGVGLGVGLGSSTPSGASARVDLGAAR
jgi:hypothetical protein